MNESRIEVNIKSTTRRIEKMEKQISNKEKSKLLHEVNKFFGQEVPEDFLPKIKECFANL